ncbi:hypothetical protein P9112_003607 [Eukaryota sp. TZLM1-RC]
MNHPTQPQSHQNQPMYPAAVQGTGETAVPMQSQTHVLQQAQPVQQQPVMMQQSYPPSYQSKKRTNPWIIVGIVGGSLLVLCIFVIVAIAALDADEPYQSPQKIRRFYGRDFFLGHEFMVDIDARDIWISNHFDGDTHLCTDSKKCRNGSPTSTCSSMTQTVLDALTVNSDAERGSTVTITEIRGGNTYSRTCTKYTHGSTEWCLTSGGYLATVNVWFQNEEMTFHITGEREVTSNEITDQCSVDPDDPVDPDLPPKDLQKIRRFYGRDFFHGYEFMIDIDARDIWISNHFDGDTHLCTDSKKCLNGSPTWLCSSMSQTVFDTLTVHPDAERGDTVQITRTRGFSTWQRVCTLYTYGTTVWCLNNEGYLISIEMMVDGEQKLYSVTGEREVTSDEIAAQC